MMKARTKRGQISYRFWACRYDTDSMCGKVNTWGMPHRLARSACNAGPSGKIVQLGILGSDSLQGESLKVEAHHNFEKSTDRRQGFLVS